MRCKIMGTMKCSVLLFILRAVNSNISNQWWYFVPGGTFNRYVITWMVHISLPRTRTYSQTISGFGWMLNAHAQHSKVRPPKTRTEHTLSRVRTGRGEFSHKLAVRTRDVIFVGRDVHALSIAWTWIRNKAEDDDWWLSKKGFQIVHVVFPRASIESKESSRRVDWD